MKTKMKFLSTVLFLISLIISMVTAQESCCEVCPAGKQKYWSIDLKKNICGECCMKPSKYWIYHIFEKGLTKAEDEHPCYNHGYSEYQKTETHGFLFIKMTLDKYILSKE